MVSKVPNFFAGLIQDNGIPPGSAHLLGAFNIDTADKFYTRIPSSEALEVFLKNKVRTLHGKWSDEAEDGRGGFVKEVREVPEDEDDFAMSDEAGNIRRLWEACRTVSTDDIKSAARGATALNETRGRVVVEDYFRQAKENGLTFSSDKVKPGIKTVQAVLKNLSTNGDFVYLDWELYNNEGDELRALRLHRAKAAGAPAASGVRLSVDPGDSSALLLRDPTLEVPRRPTVSTIVALQDVLELRMNAHDVAQMVPSPIYAELNAKLLRLFRADVPAGFRTPTISEIRKVDRDIHEEIYKWVSIGEGVLANGLAAYTSGAEKDSAFWAPALPAEVTLPDRGAETMPAVVIDEGYAPQAQLTRVGVGPPKQPSTLPPGYMQGGATMQTSQKKDPICRICNYPLSQHSTGKFCKKKRERSRSPRRNSGGGSGGGSPQQQRQQGGKGGGAGRTRPPPPKCPVWMPNCYTRTPTSYLKDPNADVCLDFHRKDKGCRGRRCTRNHDCPRILGDGTMCGQSHPAYEHV